MLNTIGYQKYYRLSEALYGIPSAPKRRHEDFCETLKHYGLIQLSNFPYLFYSKDYHTLVCIHVNDIMILGSDVSKTTLYKH